MRDRLLYTIAGTAVLSIILLLLVAGGGAAQTDPPASGDWTVSDTTVVNDRTVNLNGNLTVTATGSLTLNNVTLKIIMSTPRKHGIEVQTGGSLIIRDGDGQASTTGDASILDAQSDTLHYFFIVRSGTTLRISNSFIYRCGHNLSVGNTRLGLFVGTDDATIEGTVIDNGHHGLVLDHAVITVTDSTIGNCTYHGVNAQDSDVTLTRVTLADNGYEGARIVRGDALFDGCWVGGNRNGLQIRTGANVTINGTTVRGNTDGLLMQIDANVIVRDSVFRGQGQYGIHAENRGTLSISGSQLYGATRTALYLYNDITAISNGNLYRSNVFGARLNMDCQLTSTGDTFSTNTNSGIYLESTSDLTIVNGHVTGNSAGIKAEDASTVVAWATIVEECSFEGYSMVDSDLEVNDGSILNCTGGGITVDATSTSLLIVNPGNSSVVLSSDLTVTENYLVHDDLTLNDTTVALRIVRGMGSDEGFLCDGGVQSWQDVTFRKEQPGHDFWFRVDPPASGTARSMTIQGFDAEWP
ncbi:MAG: right-handed parallel beta-helix repeat-containing protein, partial [Candidatus Thermoplasmatota archaeon]|nr:right-handed parallel beta-helix repeat-containing protein [Candidatus Thermoplasmatota archaeon]